MESYSVEKEVTDPVGNNDANRISNPKENANILSILLFWWMNKILNLGSKRTLQSEDLLPLLEGDKAEILVETVVTEWKEQIQLARREGRHPKLWKAIMRVIPPKGYVTLVVLRLLSSASYIGLLLLIWFFLRSLSDSSATDTLTSSLYIVGIGAVSLVRGLSVHHSDHFCELWGMRLKVSVIGIVYRKVWSFFLHHISLE